MGVPACCSSLKCTHANNCMSIGKKETFRTVSFQGQQHDLKEMVLSVVGEEWLDGVYL